MTALDRFRVRSREHPSLGVTVAVYPTPKAMHAAARAYNGNVQPDDVRGVTQAAVAEGLPDIVIVRLCVGYLGTAVTSHEMHHAATALYRSLVGKRIRSSVHLTHYNETFAHLFSDLYAAMIDRLYELGYYDPVSPRGRETLA